jgi:ribonuclease T1
LVTLACAGLLSGVAEARDAAPAALTTVALADLPVEARSMHQLILQGGPFPHGKDGTVFGNRERLLPRQPRGHYREYTVETPGSRDRGARRIVCGGRQPKAPEACFYTADHYASFRKIVP